MLTQTYLLLAYLLLGSNTGYDALPTTTSIDPAPCFPLLSLLLGHTVVFVSKSDQYSVWQR